MLCEGPGAEGVGRQAEWEGGIEIDRILKEHLGRCCLRPHHYAAVLGTESPEMAEAWPL